MDGKTFLLICAAVGANTMFCMMTCDVNPTLFYAVEGIVIGVYLLCTGGAWLKLAYYVAMLGYFLFLWVAVRVLPRRLFLAMVRFIGINPRDVSP